MYSELPQATKKQLFATILSLRQLYLHFYAKNIEKATFSSLGNYWEIFFFMHLLKFSVKIIGKSQ